MQWLTATARGWRISPVQPPAIKFAPESIKEIPHMPPAWIPEPPRPPEPIRIAGPAPAGIKEFKDEKHEMQQAAATYKPKRKRGIGGTLEHETNMAAFEHESPHFHRPASANVGYSAVKSMFRR
jgi:hypothetical protein